MTHNIKFLLAIAILLMGLSGGVGKLFYLEFATSYKWFYRNVLEEPLLGFFLKESFVSFYTSSFPSREAGLPRVRLYVPQKAKNTLMLDPPKSTKKWQPGYMLHPDKKLRPIKIRNRGDNPINWAFEKKSWRIKTKKKNLINNTRVFEYIVPQFSYLQDNFLAASIGKRVGVLSPAARLVEMFINEKPYGVYYEAERLDESFLRNNGIMPVNLYKAEQVNVDRRFLVDHNSFNNPALWSKLAVFNQVPEEDHSDLTFFLNLVHQSQSSEEDFEQLKHIARFQDWARFSAYQTLTQDWNNDRRHNLRIVFDPWRGTVHPIVHDGHSFLRIYQNQDKSFNFDTHSLLGLYNTSSEFLFEKYKFLYSFIKDEILPEYHRRIEMLEPAILRSFIRNPHRMLYMRDDLDRAYAPITQEHLSDNISRIKNIIDDVQAWLIKEMMSSPKIFWSMDERYFSLIIDGPVPVDKLKLALASDAVVPEIIVWDMDGSGTISDQDMRIPFLVEGNQISLDAVFLANQVASSRPYPNSYGVIVNDFNTVATKFLLIADTPLSPIAVKGSSALTGEEVKVLASGKTGITPSRWNIPIIQTESFHEQTWPAEMTIDEVLVVDHPVKILAGTRIKMKPGASVIFRNRIRIEGTEEAPVTMTSAVPGEPWGVVALHGPDTDGSVLSHLTLEDGSGFIGENIRYIAMLSIHEAKNVEFKNLKLHRNHSFDDMVHIVYSKNIRLVDCSLSEAFSDGLDVDMSSVRITGGVIRNSKNDAIDLMESKVLVEGVELISSGDKGVSVGEASEVLIFNTRMEGNAIGVEVKDDSIAAIVNSDFVRNKDQIKASVKNWRYGGGGRAVVGKTVFSGKENPISADKHSKIEIFDSTFNTSFPKQDKQVVLDLLSDENGNQKAASQSYNMFLKKILNTWEIKNLVNVRGVIQ
jgi:hypothetical protein